MDPALVPQMLAAAAAVALVVAAILPRRWFPLAGAALTLAAAALRLPDLGPASFALAAAAGLAVWAQVRPQPQTWHLPALAALLVLPAIVSAPLALDPSPVAWFAGLIAWLLAAAASASTAAWAHAGHRQLLAALLALAPLAPRGGPWFRWIDAPVTVPDGQAALRWVVESPLPAVAPPGPALFHALDVWGPVALLLAVAVAWAVSLRRDAAAYRFVGLAALATAAVAIGAVWFLGARAALAAPPLAYVPGSPLPQPLWGGAVPRADFVWAALFVSRVAVLAWLIAPVPAPASALAHGAPPVHPAWHLRLHVAAFVLGLLLGGLWIATATGIAGGTWIADPAAFALLAVLVGTATALPAVWQGGSLGRDLGQLTQLLGAALLLGGAQAGWSVASALLP